MKINLMKNFFLKRTRLFLNLMVAFMVVFLVFSMLDITISQNTESRAISEIQSTANMQGAAVKIQMEAQFEALNAVDNMISDGADFTNKNIQTSLSSIVKTYDLCALCFADANGNVIDYLGNEIGSCADREYFQEIIDGSHTQICQYLSTTKELNEPRVILSIPTYNDNHEIAGVIFCSKEISVLKRSLFSYNDLFDASTCIYICDNSGQIIIANKRGYEYFSEDKANGYLGINIFDLNENIQVVKEQPSSIYINGELNYAAYYKLDDCGWGLYCVVDKDNLAKTFYENQERIERIVTQMLVIFIFVILYVIVLGKLYLDRKNQESNLNEIYAKNFKTILKEMNCAISEYDIHKHYISIIQPEFEEMKIDLLEGSLDGYEKLKHEHPEFNFEGFEHEMHLSKEDRKIHKIESFFRTRQQKICWLQVLIIPFIDIDKIEGKKIIAIFDVSKKYKESIEAYEKCVDNSEDTIDKCILRFNLGMKAHLQFYGMNLCKMIGYTQNDIEKIITEERLYQKLIFEEDRKKYNDFIYNLTTYGGTKKCDYRLICSDGSLFEVEDLSSVVIDDNKERICYSVILNSEKYKDIQSALQQELTEVKNQLVLSRIKNSSSQMQPHFLYNALSAIQEIILEDPNYAYDLIYDFTTHLRACIRSMSNDNLISFEEELKNVTAYVNIEKMRFGKRLNIVYDCKVTDFEIIPLGIQPIVENAIRHGIFERGTDGGTVTIRTYNQEENVIVSVEDNGVGFDYDKVMEEIKSGVRDSTGLYNLIFRFDLLLKAKLIVNSEIGKGTRIEIIIPRKTRRGGRKHYESNNSR